MTRNSPAPLSALAGVSLLLLLAAAPLAGAKGLPRVGPPGGFPFTPSADCYLGNDAGNSYDTASYFFSQQNDQCYGTVLPVVDGEDWYETFARPGTWFDVSLSGLGANDVDLCAYGPHNATLPLACSENALGLFDSLDFLATDFGEYRFEVKLATGGGLYSLQLHKQDPPPAVLPDIAVSQLRLERPVLTTALGSTGVENPVGAWRIRADVANLGGGWVCPRVDIFIAGETVLPGVATGVPYAPTFGPVGFPGGFIDVPYLCLGPGEHDAIEVQWRPLGTVGHISVTAAAYANWDLNYDNNRQTVESFVLADGL